jgi:hypothetical protein
MLMDGTDFSGILTAIATVISVYIAARVYYDSRKGPNIQFISRDCKVSKKHSASVNLSGTHKLLFMNSEDKTGSLLSISFSPSTYRNSGGGLAMTLSPSFSLPVALQPYTSILADAPFTLSGSPDVASFFAAAQGRITVNFKYEVTTKEGVKARDGSFLFVLE